MDNLIIFLLGLVWDESRRENYKVVFLSTQMKTQEGNQSQAWKLVESLQRKDIQESLKGELEKDGNPGVRK